MIHSRISRQCIATAANGIIVQRMAATFAASFSH